MCVTAKVEDTRSVWLLWSSRFVNFLVLRMKNKGCRERGVVVGKKVIVAVRASTEISKAALLWTLTHVVQPGDRIRLLVVVPSYYTSTLLFLSLPFFVFKFTSFGSFLVLRDDKLCLF